MEKFLLGPEQWQSQYRDRQIIFDKMPSEEWQYMATATGRTGVAVIAKEPLILQINHEGALCERGYFHPVARIIFDFDGCPLSIANHEGAFYMVHDLKNSEIRISGKDFGVSVTAYINEELIGVEIKDTRKTPRPVKVSVCVPYLAKTEVRGGVLTYWHENGTQTCWHEINAASGMENDDGFEDILAGRSFGLGIKAEDALPDGNGWFLPAGKSHRVWISAQSGKERVQDTLFDRLNKKLDKNALDIAQTKWFENYWQKVWFECDNKEMRPFVVGYELYRYFCAVCSGEDREFPVRFQIMLLSNITEKLHWSTMQIHSVQTIQAYFGMLRCGNWESLKPLVKDYREKMEFYKEYSSYWGAKEGFFIPYETNMWGSAHYHTLGGVELTAGEYNVYNLAKHKWSTYTFEHGLAILLFLWDAAKAKGDETEFAEWGIDAIRRYLVFFSERYPAGKDGKIIFDPATSGETWYNCKNPSSWIALFKTALPKIMEETRGRYPELNKEAERLLLRLPDLPVGHWKFTDSGVEYDRITDDNSVVLPAQEFNRNPPINWENPELYCLWPYGLFGSEEEGYELALRTYQNRVWKNTDFGWSLDCIWAARLGLTDEAKAFADWQFPTIVRFPGGFSYEASPTRQDMPYLSVLPSMQGMGNLVCPLFEMICRERSDSLLLMPAFPCGIPFRIALYTALCGRVEIEYDGKVLKCATERSAKISVNREYDIKLEVTRL